MRERASPWPRTLLVGGVLVLLAALSWAVVQARTARRAEADRWLEQQLAERRSGPVQRPTATGEAEAGEAFVHYREALALAEQLPQWDGDADPASWQPAIAALRRGARCVSVRPPGPEDSGGGDLPVLSINDLSAVVLAAARTELAAGRTVLAVDMTLDVTTFGTDLMRSWTIVHELSGAVALQAVARFWTDAALRELDEAALRRLAGGLELADGACRPQLVTLASEGVWLASVGKPNSPVDLSEVDYPLWSTWRWGFSTAEMVRSAALDSAAGIERLGALDLPWSRRRELLGEVTRERQRSTNPILRESPDLVLLEIQKRSAIARFRLLRLAVALHLGEQPPTLADPLSDDALQSGRRADGFQLASAGEDDDEPIERRVTLR